MHLTASVLIHKKPVMKMKVKKDRKGKSFQRELYVINML